MKPTPDSASKGPPLFLLLFFAIFGCIGITVLIGIWSMGHDSFGAPPVFVRIFASFIALAFIIMGFGVPLAALIKRKSIPANPSSPPSAGSIPHSTAGYQCPHCAAGLSQAEVSPSGDVKCAYCNKWYNIHRTTG